jgi:branched-subunit amino acid transport protein
MSVELVGLALLMLVVTYPSRALPILAPGLDRLPPIALEYLRLVGPAVLLALATTAVMVSSTDGQSNFHVGIEWLAVIVCAALTAWRRNLFVGMFAGVVLVAAQRALGLADYP